MVVISIINIQRKNFSTIKNLFEKLFLDSKILDKKKNWINYCQEERVNQDLTSIMFDVEFNSLPQVIQVLLKNRVQFINHDKQQQIEIGVNANTIKFLGIKQEDKELVLNGLKGYKNESAINSNDLELKFDTCQQQAQALEAMLNFIQIEDYTLQSVFLLDLSSTINQIELENTLTRIQSKFDLANTSKVQSDNQNNCNVQLNRKRKASDSQTEEISKLYEKKKESKVEKQESSLFTKKDFLQMILLIVLIGMVSCVVKGKKIF
ncbi:transmembrane protein, putative (macronuclear) [Tetrahymena thermophila SB210]|uniref:Transmembrane protein, putative n=1 Tax=Tetrahymena thermophila (strain SB210) TaxID=312017 RepID=Q22MU2_TETTS|nr:transmembrane protein, putative [Tetrahymena thermophila SB210]EAR86265.1 transmembrane protein, putative [Tetrahymena thermophila SB210]|eukprot:XP_976928.1 transmembrane protein, putative [Tetrahymena thermophila SB210]